MINQIWSLNLTIRVYRVKSQVGQIMESGNLITTPIHLKIKTQST